jgi:hypothetical protein
MSAAADSVPMTVMMLPCSGPPVILENDYCLKTVQMAVEGRIEPLPVTALRIAHAGDAAWKTANALTQVPGAKAYVNEDGLYGCVPNFRLGYHTGSGVRPIHGTVAVVVPTRYITATVRAAITTERLIRPGVTFFRVGEGLNMDAAEIEAMAAAPEAAALIDAALDASRARTAAVIAAATA